MNYKLGGDDIYDAIDEIKDRFDKIEREISQLKMNDTYFSTNISKLYNELYNETNNLAKSLEMLKALGIRLPQVLPKSHARVSSHKKLPQRRKKR